MFCFFFNLIVNKFQLNIQLVEQSSNHIYGVFFRRRTRGRADGVVSAPLTMTAVRVQSPARTGFIFPISTVLGPTRSLMNGFVNMFENFREVAGK